LRVSYNMSLTEAGLGEGVEVVAYTVGIADPLLSFQGLETGEGYLRPSSSQWEGQGVSFAWSIFQIV
jgi:hypothetical protein